MSEKLRATSRGGTRPNSGQLVALLPEADADELAETLVAFANSDGGTIYIGVAEGGVPTGYDFAEEINAVVEQSELRCRPPVLANWTQTEVAGRFVFVGHVTRSHELHSLDDGRVLVRAGVENRPLSGQQILQVASSRSTGDYEAQSVPGATRADFDDDVLNEFLKVWQERQARQLTRPVDDHLTEKGWLSPNGQPTVAGILLFCKTPETFLPRCGVTLVKFDGQTTRRTEETPSYGRRVEITGPLAHVITRTHDILKEELHRGAVVRGLKREEQWIYPPMAVREALVNAVAHRDYRLSGRAIEVKMYADRLEISSPGGLPGYITLDNIVDEHYSRNPRIVNGLYQWGHIEELGMGVDLMIEEMINAGHPLPQFSANEASFTVTFRSERVRMPRLDNTANLTMNERQTKVLNYLQQNDRVRSRDYQELCPDVSPETLRLDLADLVEHGILLKIGRKRGTYYILK
ncbi:MAG: putative DNA binding domain-containing protein [Anaerolineae bacterium]|nr:putative DNA binding domain-containing protein [Anaerolineae bacterium]